MGDSFFSQEHCRWMGLDEMKMMIYKSEWYPIYTIDDGDLCVEGYEIPDDKVEWINRVNKEFQEVQDYLKNKTYIKWGEHGRV